MGIYVPMFSSCCVFTDDLAAYAQAHGGEIIKVNIYHEDPAARDCSRRALSHLPLQLTDAETTSLESTAQGVTKARGLETLCTHLGISLADCVMVGDSSNDLEVLRVVGRPVAMGNATPEVLALAGDVVASNDDDGVAEVVRRIVLT